ncbi:MAG: hypothetical protein HFJ47_01575 [Clostridia bacterium]|nr:hypothetical protein [Clostridia bacterium]
MTKKVNKISRWISVCVVVVVVLCSNMQIFAQTSSNQAFVNDEGITISVVKHDNEVDNMIVPYSSYTTSGSFKVQLRTPTRYFDGNNINCTITTHNSAGTDNGYPSTFKIALYRDGFWDDHIGTATVSREAGTYTVTWSNVGPGNYYFVFSKADDGTTQYATETRFYN